MTEKTMLEITKRPWYTWLAWILWVVLDIFLIQNALASSRELEPMAATIFWIMFFVILIGGMVVYFLRRNKN